MINAILVRRVEGKLQIETVQLTNPVKHGWTGFSRDIREKITPEVERFITPHLDYIGPQAEEGRAPDGEIDRVAIYAPCLLIGTVWTDQDRPEPVSLTENQQANILRQLGGTKEA